MFPFDFSKLFETVQVWRERIPETEIGNSECTGHSRRLNFPFATGHSSANRH